VPPQVPPRLHELRRADFRFTTTCLPLLQSTSSLAHADQVI
jgi:hypothetical protein